MNLHLGPKLMRPCEGCVSDLAVGSDVSQEPTSNSSEKEDKVQGGFPICPETRRKPSSGRIRSTARKQDAKKRAQGLGPTSKLGDLWQATRLDSLLLICGVGI